MSEKGIKKMIQGKTVFFRKKPFLKSEHPPPEALTCLLPAEPVDEKRHACPGLFRLQVHHHCGGN